MRTSRRAVLAAIAAATASACAARGGRRERDALARLRQIEADSGGLAGVHVHDTHTGERIGHRDGERFAMCSTFKLPLAAAVLARVDAGAVSLEQRIAFGREDLLDYAPVTSRRVDEGAMSVSELCAAMVELSDNPAANLLLPLVGGPAGFTAWLRGLGDRHTRLDRIEPDLNTNLPGDPRDTTTPRAMVDTMSAVLLGDTLSPASRERLIGWLIAARTGLARIRAGLPATWRAGDKTGTGLNGAANDVAIAWPPGRRPLLLAVYLTGSPRPMPELNATHAAIARAVTA